MRKKVWLLIMLLLCFVVAIAQAEDKKTVTRRAVTPKPAPKAAPRVEPRHDVPRHEEVRHEEVRHEEVRHDMGRHEHDFRDFHGRDYRHMDEHMRYAWGRGFMRHEFLFGRWGYWWVVDGLYYWYPTPFVGVPLVVPDVIFEAPVAPAPVVIAPPMGYRSQAPVMYWCDDPPGYSNTVQHCNSEWRTVSPPPPPPSPAP